MSDVQSSYGWVLAGVSTIVGTLASVVARFYYKESKSRDAIESELKANIEKLQSDVDECRTDRETLRVDLAVTNANYSSLKASSEGLELRIANIEKRIKGN